MDKLQISLTPPSPGFRPQAGRAANRGEVLREMQGRSPPTCQIKVNVTNGIRRHAEDAIPRRAQSPLSSPQQDDRMTGLPRWYIKRHAARLGLTMTMDRKPWTPAELSVLENLVGRAASRRLGER